MIKKMRKTIALCVFGIFMATGGALAFELKDLIGVVGGGFLVGALAEPLNDFINTVTFNRGVGAEESTKVVPILTVGSGTAIGAAQVSGPAEPVENTRAVAQLEVKFRDRFRVEILIPIDSTNPLKQFRRVQQVGLSALIDYRL